eukprot:1147314-Pelagomonas_calceolata.AAC.10
MLQTRILAWSMLVSYDPIDGARHATCWGVLQVLSITNMNLGMLHAGEYCIQQKKKSACQTRQQAPRKLP